MAYVVGKDLGFFEAYLGKAAAEPLSKSVARVEDVASDLWKTTHPSSRIPSQLLGNTGIMRKTAPARRAALLAAVAGLFGGIGGAGIADFALPNTPSAVAVGALTGAAATATPVALLTYLSQKARQRTEDREAKRWRKILARQD